MDQCPRAGRAAQADFTAEGALAHAGAHLFFAPVPSIPITLHARLTERPLQPARYRTILCIYTVFRGSGVLIATALGRLATEFICRDFYARR